MNGCGKGIVILLDGPFVPMFCTVLFRRNWCWKIGWPRAMHSTGQERMGDWTRMAPCFLLIDGIVAAAQCSVAAVDSWIVRAMFPQQ